LSEQDNQMIQHGADRCQNSQTNYVIRHSTTTKGRYPRRRDA
jgi:hypothetical protein